jgi:hypothetical protein
MALSDRVCLRQLRDSQYHFLRSVRSEPSVQEKRWTGETVYQQEAAENREIKTFQRKCAE